jgi:HD-GYP domain-containing protein (c-di-GMP phosphodiesterase class II)
MAVADVFTALMEDRPYRAGMHQAAAKKVICAMVTEKALDHDIVVTLLDNFEELNGIRSAAQSVAVREYREIRGNAPFLTSAEA